LIKRIGMGNVFQATSPGSVGFKFGKGSTVWVSDSLVHAILNQSTLSVALYPSHGISTPRGLRIHKCNIGSLVVLKMVIAFI
jgi:hypothetical protein